MPLENPAAGAPRRMKNIGMAHSKDMKVSCIICGALLVAFGLCAAVNALFSFNLLWFLCFQNETLFRVAQGLQGVCAAWLAFWLIAFRPQNDLR